MGATEDFFALFHRSAFRVEALPQYLGTSTPAFRAFEASGRLTPLDERPAKQNWMHHVFAATAAGVHVARVHVLDLPLSSYLRYELAAYPENIEAGEDVFIAVRSAHRSLGDLTTDFWLLDDKEPSASVLLMHYDDEGRFTAQTHTDEPEVLRRCRAQRDLALAHAVPYDQFIATSNTNT